jgi:hypothetical protein
VIEKDSMKFSSVRTAAMSLPEVTEQPHHEYSSYRVRGKIFVTIPPSEEWVHLFVSEATRDDALDRYPTFIEPLMWGGKLAGLKVWLQDANAAVVKSLIAAAWESKAPASLRTDAPSAAPAKKAENKKSRKSP